MHSANRPQAIRVRRLLQAALILLPAVAGCTCPCHDQAQNITRPQPRKFAVAPIANPRSIAIDSLGNLYVGDAATGAILKITPDGSVTPIGGSAASLISDPLGLGVGPDGSVYIANGSGGGVYRIAPGAQATPIADSGADLLVTPIGVAIDSHRNAFIANNGANNILKISPNGAVSVFAGTVGVIGSADGKGSQASFATPRAITIDARGNLYVADEGNSNIRKITPDGVVTTLAGKAGDAGSADGSGAAAAFGAPRSLAAAADGTLYIADTDNNTIRKITPQGVVSTLAGKPGDSGYADGPGAPARFSEPRGIAVDGSGNLFVADSGNACIRQITPAGIVTTIAAPSRDSR